MLMIIVGRSDPIQQIQTKNPDAMFVAIQDHMTLIMKNITKNITFRAHPDQVRVCAGLNAIKTEYLMHRLIVNGRMPKKVIPVHVWIVRILIRFVDSDQAKKLPGWSVRGFILLYQCQDES